MGYPLIKQKEIENIKLLLSKGLTTKDITTITGRSKSTIERVARGEYDTPESTDNNLEALKDLMQRNLETLVKIDEVLRRAGGTK
jgi:IS30 family transposase